MQKKETWIPRNFGSTAAVRRGRGAHSRKRGRTVPVILVTRKDDASRVTSVPLREYLQRNMIVTFMILLVRVLVPSLFEYKISHHLRASFRRLKNYQQQSHSVARRCHRILQAPYSGGSFSSTPHRRLGANNQRHRHVGAKK